MSYQALARAFRPQNFTELVGQEHVSQALINGLEQNRIHHAFLFTGTRGVGKTTVARILAKALNCEKGVTGSPCGSCSSCTEISQGRFVDLVEVDAASRTGVDDTRDLLDNVQYAPTKGRYKIYLIDEVHMFSNSSFNALLKTLEEPPPHVKFLLATTEPKKLPITVLSRCLQFNLKRLSLPQIRDHLIKLLEIQKIEFETNAIELIARAADGSMRDGLSLLDQSLAYGAGSVLEKDVKLMLGTMDHDQVVDILNNIIDKNAQNLSMQLSQIFAMSPDYSLFLDEMALLLHELSLFQILNQFVDNSPFDRQSIKKLISKTNPEQVQLFYQIVLKGQAEINIAPDTKTGFEMTIIRLFAFKIGSGKPSSKPIVDNSTVQENNKSHNIQQRQTTNNTHRSNKSTVTNNTQNHSQSSQKINLSEINEQTWHHVFSELKLKGTARELARNAHVLNNENNILLLAIDKQAHAFMTDNAKKMLAQAIENKVNEPISVQYQQGSELSQTVAKSEQKKQDTHRQETKQKVNQNPFIQHMQENFDAQVIQIKQGESFI